MASRSTKLVLLDRDGVINYDSPEYVKTPEEWVPIPGSIEAIAALKRAGFAVAVCSNQAGVGRGIIEREDLDRIHQKLHATLAAAGVVLDALAVCTHHPDDGCRCRKPAPGMLLQVMRELGIGPEQTCCVGDSVRDVQAALAAGCCSVLVLTGNGAADEVRARRLGNHQVYADLAAFAAALLGEEPCF
ncbi:MAG: D-glycero-beta-D-manno-heptose 1,7-bisphosphate 7-phosphatase [Pseudomonadales bacterium]